MIIHFYVYSRKDGRQVRLAKPAEVRRYWTGQTHPRFQFGSIAFAHPVALSKTLFVDASTGPGGSVSGAGF